MDNSAMQTILRVVHIATAIVLVGGTVFLRFVLLPSVKKIPEEIQLDLRDRLANRWKWIVHGGIALLLVSGFYNYLVVMRPMHTSDKRYDMFVGIKMLLAFLLFFLASALVGRSQVLKKFRDRSSATLLVMIVVALTIVGISGYLKIRGIPLLSQ
ncbi:MAG: hypothetical protein QF363_18520 [Planctomycetaceae bacterium]|jgi:uncharacterized membrane protein|nr:hypothetical protein [Planctomycetaceae bacterium]